MLFVLFVLEILLVCNTLLILLVIWVGRKKGCAIALHDYSSCLWSDFRVNPTSFQNLTSYTVSKWKKESTNFTYYMMVYFNYSCWLVIQPKMWRIIRYAQQQQSQHERSTTHFPVWSIYFLFPGVLYGRVLLFQWALCARLILSLHISRIVICTHTAVVVFPWKRCTTERLSDTKNWLIETLTTLAPTI